MGRSKGSGLFPCNQFTLAINPGVNGSLLLPLLPHCGGYVGIVLREPGENTPLQAVNGLLRCTYRIAWIVDSL
jgi:hypothetical protein